MSLPVIATLLIIGVTIYQYNKIAKLKLLVSEGWSGIDVHLRERHDLIPNLVAVVKEYASHERTLLEDVTKSRGTNNKGELEQLESTISAGIGSILAIAEDYPDLKAGENFNDLSDQLVKIEDKIQFARRYYNGTVRNYNIAIKSFPGNIIANLFSFNQEAFFTVETSLRKENLDVTLD